MCSTSLLLAVLLAVRGLPTVDGMVVGCAPNLFDVCSLPSPEVSLAYQ
jgi:hypothetical protein